MSYREFLDANDFDPEDADDLDPDDYEISMHGPPPGTPGTCCPEQRIIDGQCKSCSHVFDEVLALITKEAHWLRCMDPLHDEKYGICLICGGTHKITHHHLCPGRQDEIYPCPGCVRCCETCDWVTMHDDELTGHCLKDDIEVEFDYCCNKFVPLEV